MSTNKKILFWGELPPNTVHGISLSNIRILDAIAENFDVIKVEDKASFGNIVRKLYSLLASLVLLSFYSLKKIDIFYVNNPMSRLGLWKVFIAARIVLFFSPKTKIISHLHRGDFLEFISDDGNRDLFERFASIIDSILVLSNKSRVELAKSATINESKIKVLHNTIKPICRYDELSIVDNNIDISERFYYCLCNYIETKRIHSLVSVANQLSLQVMFNGTSSSEQYMKRLKSIDSASLCSFDGLIHGRDKELKLNKAKALILPSQNEGMPLVILESLAQGTPVICYDIGYISDYVGEDYPGLVHELSDEAMKAKIQWLESLSYSDYQSLRKYSHHLFWDNFNPKDINNTALQIFSEL